MNSETPLCCPHSIYKNIPIYNPREGSWMSLFCPKGTSATLEEAQAGIDKEWPNAGILSTTKVIMRWFVGSPFNLVEVCSLRGRGRCDVTNGCHFHTLKPDFMDTKTFYPATRENVLLVQFLHSTQDHEEFKRRLTLVENLFAEDKAGALNDVAEWTLVEQPRHDP